MPAKLRTDSPTTQTRCSSRPWAPREAPSPRRPSCHRVLGVSHMKGECRAEQSIYKSAKEPRVPANITFSHRKEQACLLLSSSGQASSSGPTPSSADLTFLG